MTWLKVKSLERYLNNKLYTLVLLPLLLIWIVFISFILLPLEGIIIGFILIVLFSLVLISGIKNTIFKSFNRAILHLEAINQEDYNQFGKTPFSSGIVAQFHHQLNLLSEKLQQQKSRYDQHAFLVYQLISELDTPILVFNEKQQLSFANDAFYHLYGQHWQMLRYSSAAKLQLELLANKWQFSSAEKKQQWQIRQSEFIDAGQRHQLLIFIDIAAALRANQLDAWQQIIRVLGHEIGNSLAPVSSMAESLSSKTNDERDKMVLRVINERCQHLQHFVARYGELAKPLQLSPHWFSLKSWFTDITRLYEQINFSLITEVKQLWADETLLTQVFINLCKNAQEANASQISLTVKQTKQYYELILLDNGHGISNLDNLFVPLYSTKPNGQGIGLHFCRNIIEHHQGTMTLFNNEQQGVRVQIKLPLTDK